MDEGTKLTDWDWDQCQQSLYGKDELPGSRSSCRQYLYEVRDV